MYIYICLFQVLQEEVGLLKLVDMFCTEGYNKHANLNYLAPLLSNLTQLPEARNLIVDKDRCVRTVCSGHNIMSSSFLELLLLTLLFHLCSSFMVVCMISKDTLSHRLFLGN